MLPADLSPFGFTPTEARAYAALLRLGPSTGYAVAREVRIAPANAYQALAGLTARGAAQRAPGRPLRFRATDPQTLIAQLATEQGEALERLSQALAHGAREPESATREVRGARALGNLVMQLVARAEERVDGILAAELWRPTLPAWRRAAARAALAVRLAGEAPDPEGLAAGTVAGDVPTLLVIDGRHVITASRAAEGIAGLWSSHPLLVALGRAALAGWT